MKTRRLGRTNLQVSELVFGAGYVGGIMVLPEDDVKRKALRRAFDAGINWVDTAPLYGQGKSEEALGRLLKDFPEQPYLSTKVNVDDYKDIAGDIERSVAASLKRLNRDSVDLLQLHNRIGGDSGANRTIGIREIEKVIEGLERMRAQKLTKFIGLTALGEMPHVLRAIDSGRFDTAQVYYNMLNPSAARRMPPAWSGHDFAGVIDACKRHDMGIMNIRVFASGALATDARHGREVPLTENSDLKVEAQRAQSALNAVGSSYGTRAQTALRFSLGNADLSCVIIGLAELDHLEQAIGAQAKGPLPREAVAKLDGVYERGFAA